MYSCLQIRVKVLTFDIKGVIISELYLFSEQCKKIRKNFKNVLQTQIHSAKIKKLRSSALIYKGGTQKWKLTMRTC